jgi:phosphoglycolate phosphatase
MPYEIPEHIEAVVVDLDGTMVDTLGDFEAALGAMTHELGVRAVSRADIGRMVGKGSEHLIRSVLAHVDAPQEKFDAAWDAYQRHYLAINGRYAAVYPGVAEGLQALHARPLKLACLTNKPSAFVRPLLESKGLARWFDVVRGGDDFPVKKPDPLPLVKTCEALRSDPARTLMIGDSSNDAKAARAAGCRVVLVTYGYNHGEPVQAVDADGYIDSLAELA